MRTVFHVSTTEQLSYVDAKVRNLLADETVSIEDAIVLLDASDAIEAAVGPLRSVTETVLKAGGSVEFCSNAAAGATSDLQDLPDGVEVVPSGVGELTRLQDEGYAYIRP